MFANYDSLVFTRFFQHDDSTFFPPEIFLSTILHQSIDTKHVKHDVKTIFVFNHMLNFLSCRIGKCLNSIFLSQNDFQRRYKFYNLVY